MRKKQKPVGIKGDTVSYYAYAGNRNGLLEQLYIVRKNAKPYSQERTGKIYKNDEEAQKDMMRLNCGKEISRPFAGRHQQPITSRS